MPFFSDLQVGFFGFNPGTLFNPSKTLHDNFFSMCNLSLLKPNSKETDLLISNLKAVKLNCHSKKKSTGKEMSEEQLKEQLSNNLHADIMTLGGVKLEIDTWLRKRDPYYSTNKKAHTGFPKVKPKVKIAARTDTQIKPISSRVKAVWDFLYGINELMNTLQVDRNRLYPRHQLR